MILYCWNVSNSNRGYFCICLISYAHDCIHYFYDISKMIKFLKSTFFFILQPDLKSQLVTVLLFWSFQYFCLKYLLYAIFIGFGVRIMNWIDFPIKLPIFWCFLVHCVAFMFLIDLINEKVFFLQIGSWSSVVMQIAKKKNLLKSQKIKEVHFFDKNKKKLLLFNSPFLMF